MKVLPEIHAYIALGSNVGDSRHIIREAFEVLSRWSVRPIVKSSLWKSTPVDCPPGSPDFINAACRITPSRDLTPEILLRRLQDTEKVFGREEKKVINEPRALDLDIIWFDEEPRNTRKLILPHPRAHLRKFVLAPLAEIAPELVLPGQTKSVRNLLEDLKSPERIELL